MTSRKQPRQARSTDLVAAILEAALRVLATEGASRFTTTRVAEKAGISIGSLYQYFPNKAAILFRLQGDEWVRTTALLGSILEDERYAPLDRLRRLVGAFLRSECEEAAVRLALADASPLYRDAPEAKAARQAGEGGLARFVAAQLPNRPPEEAARAARLIGTAMSAVGKRFSAEPRAPEEISVEAEALADMLCGYLERLGV